MRACAKNAYLCGSQGIGTEQQIHPDRVCTPCFNRNHPRRQALATPGKLINELPTCVSRMKKQHGISTTRTAIGIEQRFNAQAQIGDTRILVAQGAGRADRGAGTAALAEVRINLDRVAV